MSKDILKKTRNVKLISGFTLNFYWFNSILCKCVGVICWMPKSQRDTTIIYELYPHLPQGFPR